MPVEHRQVNAVEAGMRLDRWFAQHFPELKFGQLQKLLRTGQIRVDGGRVRAGTRLEPGQTVRIPPFPSLPRSAVAASSISQQGKRSAEDIALLEKMVIYRDEALLALNKPSGLAVQGGSRTHRHIDGLLQGLAGSDGTRPRLVHRLDKDTSGVLLLARNRVVAAALGELFRRRQVEKLYWALVVGVPHAKEGEIRSHLDKQPSNNRRGEKVASRREKGDKREKGEKSGKFARTRYRVLATAGERFAWLEMQPLTGRTHQLRVHAAELGHPIVGDGKYGGAGAHPGGGIAGRLHLHARTLALPSPVGTKQRAQRLEITAPLPEHMAETWALLGFDLQS